MNKNRKIFSFGILMLVISFSCSDQLDVKNPNEPTVDGLGTELGIVSFAKGGTYINGFVRLKYADGVLGRFLRNGYHDLWADVVGAEAANVFMNQIGAPYSVFLDNSSEVPNPGAPRLQSELINNNNINANAGNNPLFYEWAQMYSLNNVCNIILTTADNVNFTNDGDVKKDVLKAWAYWWKGFAYFRVGSIYYAGLIIDSPNSTNGNYKTRAEILAESERNLAEAEGILNSLSDDDVYYDFLGQIIPDFVQVGKGEVPSPAMWIRNINTLRARTILVNSLATELTASDWNEILTLTNNGIQSTDMVFTVRANGAGDIISAASGTIHAASIGNPLGEATYKISERLIQDFRSGDQRKANNFDQVTAWIGESARGNSFNTRWALVDGGHGMDGVITYGSKTPLEQETYIGPTYEENQLMKAEANIYLGNVNTGLALIDEVRNYQGAGLSALTGSGMSSVNAILELRSERRVALLFRYLAFYDARRYKVIEPIADGGGRTGAIVVDNNGVVNTNATIDYRFMDYFHVPDNEIASNPPLGGSAPIKNPKYD